MRNQVSVHSSATQHALKPIAFTQRFGPRTQRAYANVNAAGNHAIATTKTATSEAASHAGAGP